MKQFSPNLSKEKARKFAIVNRLAMQSSNAGDSLSRWAQTINSLLISKESSCGGFLPQISEPGSRKLLISLSDMGHKIYCPRIHNSSKELLWVYYTGQEQIGKYNIPEPVGVAETYRPDFKLILLPALLIDSHGNRLGRGGGYYDKVLSTIDTRQTTCIAIIGDDELLAENDPREWIKDPWDIPVDYCLRPSFGLHKFSRS